jgi:hypothetical protein
MCVLRTGEVGLAGRQGSIAARQAIGSAGEVCELAE